MGHHIKTPVFVRKHEYSGVFYLEKYVIMIKRRNYCREEVGEDNVFAATIHMDERNPHMHVLKLA